MKKIGDSTNTATESGEWTEGNPAAGAAATLLKADWLNTIQREIIAVVLAAGLTLNKNDDSQLSKAVRALIAAEADSKISSTPQMGYAGAVADIPVSTLGTYASGTTDRPPTSSGGLFLRMKYPSGNIAFDIAGHVGGGSDLLSFRRVLADGSYVWRAVWHDGNFDPASKANLASPSFTGQPMVPTPPIGSNYLLVANTEFVTKAITSYAAQVTQALAGKANKGTVVAEYGITDVYTKLQVEALLNQRVSADTIIAAGFVSGDINKPYFLERKPDGSAGFIINLALSNHQHTFASLTAKPTTRDGYGLTDVYTKQQTEVLLNQRVSADSIVSAGLVSGDVNSPYFLQAGTNAILHLARKAHVDAKPDADWVDAVGLASNNPKIPYMRQRGGGNIVLVASSELPRNTCKKGIPGWWRCADTGLLRQRVSISIGDVSTAWAGAVTWPLAFPEQADAVKLSFVHTNGSPATVSAAYADLTTTGCKLRVDEWGTNVQYGLTLIVEVEGY